MKGKVGSDDPHLILILNVMLKYISIKFDYSLQFQ